MFRVAIPLAAIALVACGTESQAFRPASHATGETTQGEAVAEYDLTGPAGSVASVRVWSKGAWEAEVDGDDRTLVHVALEVRNEQPAALRIDPSRFRADFQDERRRYEGLPPLSVRGPTEIAAGSNAELEVTFAVPAELDPSDIRAFRVHWSVSGGEREFAKATPFVQKPEPYVRPGAGHWYASPHWDPFYGPRAGWGWGVGGGPFYGW